MVTYCDYNHKIVMQSAATFEEETSFIRAFATNDTVDPVPPGPPTPIEKYGTLN